MIFQSVGTNYSFADAVKQLFVLGSKRSSEQLKKQLESDFGGTAVLYSKGRNALSEAVKLVAEGKMVAVNAMTCSPNLLTSHNLSAKSQPQRHVAPSEGWYENFVYRPRLGVFN